MAWTSELFQAAYHRKIERVLYSRDANALLPHIPACEAGFSSMKAFVYHSSQYPGPFVASGNKPGEPILIQQVPFVQLSPQADIECLLQEPLGSLEMNQTVANDQRFETWMASIDQMLRGGYPVGWIAAIDQMLRVGNQVAFPLP
jgi:hypothetical protein